MKKDCKDLLCDCFRGSRNHWGGCIAAVSMCQDKKDQEEGEEEEKLEEDEEVEAGSG